MIEYRGNNELLKYRKTAFFAPGKSSVASVMPRYGWATEMARRNEYVVSIADRLVFASVNPDSSLYPIYTKYNQKSTLIYE